MDRRRNVPQRPRSAGGRRATGRAGGFSGSVGLGGEQVEGRRAVLELLLAGRRKVREVNFDQGLERTGLVAEIADRALEGRIPLRDVSKARFDALAKSESSQGVIAFAEALSDKSLEDVVRRFGNSTKLVILDHVTDPRNLGAILRSAECAGFQGVVIPERRSTKVTPTVTKAAAGSIEYLDFILTPGIPHTLAELAKLGVWSIGLDPSASESIWSVDLTDQPIAVVLGSEGKGLSRLARQRVDRTCSIPQLGKIDSLNVSAAATVAFFELSRKRN